jgi:sodium/bile acid cotransporter 7
MKASLQKHWFLFLLASGIALAFLCPQWLRPFTDRLEPRTVVGLALFLMAASLESQSLFSSLSRPLPAVWAVLISYGAIPALAWWVAGFIPDIDLQVGLLIAASVPCTLASAVLWTRMAGGNEATALLVVFLMTSLSWLVTTFWLAWTVGAKVVLDPLEMMRGLVLVLVLPVGLGQLSRTIGLLRSTVARYKSIVGFVSRILVWCIILKALVGAYDRLADQFSSLPVGAMIGAGALSLGVHLAALVGGLWSSKALRFDRSNQIAVAFSCSQKTLPVGLYLFDSYFKDSRPLALVPLVCYHMGQLVVDTFIADALLKRGGRIQQESHNGP